FSSDFLALLCAWQWAGFLNQFYSPMPPGLTWWVWLGLPGLFWIFVALTLLLFIHYGLYSATVRAKNYLKAGQLISYLYLFSLVATYFYDPKLDPPRSLFFTAWISSVGLVILARLVANLVFAQVERSQPPVRVFLIARANRLRHLSRTIKNRSHYQIVGAAMASTASSMAIFQSILRTQPDEVLAEDLPEAELASSLFWRLRGTGIPLRLLPSSREMLYRRGIPEVFAGLPTLHIELSIFQTLDYRIKRWLDYLVALLGLAALAPILVAIAVTIKATSPGPIFFRQERVGLHGRIFHVWKFRTMHVNAAQLQAALEHCNESQDGILFKIRHDPRVTSIGRFLRRTSLDELPQLFNVLLGQMSLVGPRPLPLRDISKFEPWHHIRHQVLPGITGLWQTSGRSDIENFDDAARLDLHYIDNWSLNLDLDILIATVQIVVFRQGAY
ncbi:MAG: sugar transferase, partial [Leptolyngbya sp. SIO4C1]|nr:sugar transferase [Leptolyngbya sp. SIO4C1]